MRGQLPAVRLLLQAAPQAAVMRDCDGRTPLTLALSNFGHVVHDHYPFSTRKAAVARYLLEEAAIEPQDAGHLLAALVRARAHEKVGELEAAVPSAGGPAATDGCAVGGTALAQPWPGSSAAGGAAAVRSRGGAAGAPPACSRAVRLRTIALCLGADSFTARARLMCPT